MSHVLVINSGSSSIKYCLFSVTPFEELARGAIEGIGEAETRFFSHSQGKGEAAGVSHSLPVADHRAGLALIAADLRAGSVNASLDTLYAIGHRVVHGGATFHEATLIDEAVLRGIRATISLAPLHNPACLLGIEVAMQEAPRVPQVAVFDTAFHHTMPGYASRYALPASCHSRYGVRRYGFHGISHAWVSREAAALLGRPLHTLNLITLHLGNGASAAAIEGGRCVDTSMGMTPLEGLVMGTRCGDLDPSIPLYLEREAGMDREAVDALLNRESGLKGICGANDMREVLRRADSGDEDARLALDMYCYRIRKYIGAYYAVLGRVDAVVFTGGVGENAARVRQQCCKGLESLGMLLDEERNQAGRGAFTFHRDDSPVGLLVIPTNEEQEIARQTMACIDQE